RRVVDEALPHVDLADVVALRADDEDAALLRRREELEQVGQRYLFDAAAHRAGLGRPARRGDVLEVALRVRRVARAFARDDLQDRRADEDAVAFLQARPLDLLTVDEGAVRGPEIFDPDLVLLHVDARVLAADHVLDEHHVEVAGATD